MPVNEVAIIGNGNSNGLFHGEYDYVVACNIPQHTIKYNALSIIDERPLTYMKNSSWRPRVPVMCNTQVKRYAHKTNIEGDWFDVYERVHRWNSGHLAALYYSQQCKTVHLWGFDSLFSDDLTSQVDSVIPRHGRPKLNKHWHPIWLEVFAKSKCNFVLHIPKGEQSAVSHEKLTTITHGKTPMAMDDHNIEQAAITT